MRPWKKLMILGVGCSRSTINPQLQAADYDFQKFGTATGLADREGPSWSGNCRWNPLRFSFEALSLQRRTMHLMSTSVHGPEAALRFLSFVNASPTPFHAVHNAIVRLEKAGFQKVLEKDAWEDSVQPGGKYYFTRNQV
jgi:hypothetical protein